MQAIICKNDAKTVLTQMQEYIKKHSIIGGMLVVDATDNQIVVLLDNEPIDTKMAKVWWSGFKAALE